MASCCPWSLLKVRLLILLTPGFLHQLQLCGRRWHGACRFLRVGLQPPGAALHSPDQPGSDGGQHHPYTFLHAHPKVTAGQAGRGSGCFHHSQHGTVEGRVERMRTLKRPSSCRAFIPRDVKLSLPSCRRGAWAQRSSESGACFKALMFSCPRVG